MLTSRRKLRSVLGDADDVVLDASKHTVGRITSPVSVGRATKVIPSALGS